MDSIEEIQLRRKYEKSAVGCQIAAILQRLRTDAPIDEPGQSTRKLICNISDIKDEFFSSFFYYYTVKCEMRSESNWIEKRSKAGRLKGVT